MAVTRLKQFPDALEHNFRQFQALVGHDVKIAAMVKGNGYGYGISAAAKVFAACGAEMLVVATAAEGAKLRSAGFDNLIGVTMVTPWDVDQIVKCSLIPFVSSQATLDALTKRINPGSPVEVHIEIDTGFHRGGFAPAAVAQVVSIIGSSPGLELSGVMTHLACADDLDKADHTEAQLTRFVETVGGLNFGDRTPLIHAANTAAAINYPDARYDMVRLGLGLYGYHPSIRMRTNLDLRPSVKLLSKVSQLVEVPPGETVGYGGRYVAPPEGAVVAVVPAGYHDGLPRALSNNGSGLIDGVPYQIAGTISMDSLTLLVTGADVQVGDEVELLGADPVSAEQLASRTDTINYETLSRLGERPPRF